MARLRLLGAALVVVALSLVSAPAHAASSECAAIDRLSGLCSAVSGHSVVLTGSQTATGSADGAAGGAVGINTGAYIAGVVTGRTLCYVLSQRTPDVCAPADPGIPTITIQDIAAFRPIPGRQQMEPDGWTVAGLDTNFFAITGPHVVNGTLLGRPADVRFTPVAYHWAYGDGSSATKATKGGTWASLGIAEFDPTPTSHVYEQLGDYTITLSITFAAEYRFAGGPWRPVVGTITLPANDLHLRVGTAKTVLVEHDCAQNAGGPGC